MLSRGAFQVNCCHEDLPCCRCCCLAKRRVNAQTGTSARVLQFRATATRAGARVASTLRRCRHRRDSRSGVTRMSGPRRVLSRTSPIHPFKEKSLSEKERKAECVFSMPPNFMSRPSARISPSFCAAEHGARDGQNNSHARERKPFALFVTQHGPVFAFALASRVSSFSLSHSSTSAAARTRPPLQAPSPPKPSFPARCRPPLSRATGRCATRAPTRCGSLLPAWCSAA